MGKKIWHEAASVGKKMSPETFEFFPPKTLAICERIGIRPASVAA